MSHIWKPVATTIAPTFSSTTSSFWVKSMALGFAQRLAGAAGIGDLPVRAVVLPEADARVGIDHRYARHRLEGRHIDGRSRAERLFRIDAGLLQHDLDRAGGADDGARTAADALPRLLHEGGADLAIDAALGEVQHVRLHHIVADPHAQPAQDALLVRVIHVEGRLGQAVLRGQLLDDRHVRGAGEQQPQDHLAGFAHLR